MSKNILILQHINIETPGYILDLMERDKFNLTTIELDEGETIQKILTNLMGCFVWEVLWIRGWKKSIHG